MANHLRLWKDGLLVTEGSVTIGTSPPPTTGRRVILGSSTPPQTRHGTNSKEAEARWLEGQIGHKLDATRHYIKAPNAWTGDGADSTIASGRMPVISFTSGGDSWAQVANGSLDSYVKNQVAALNQRGGLWLKAILGFENEPEAESPGKGTPAQYVAAYNHLITVMRAAGLKNVLTTYLMEFSWQTGSGRNPDLWVPNVTWLGCHGYSTRVGSCGDSIRTFVDTFDAPHATAKKFGKPLGVFEAGYATKAGADPAKKGDFFRSIPTAMGFLPLLRAYVYWNMSGGACDLPNSYFFDSSRASMEGLADTFKDPVFNGPIPSMTTMPERALQAGAEPFKRGAPDWEITDDMCPRCGSIMTKVGLTWRCDNCRVKDRPAEVQDHEIMAWKQSLIKAS